MKEIEYIDGNNQQDSEESIVCHVHRVGTVTCGLVLILYGILFLIHTVIPRLDYYRIFSLWPVILIVLGGEILASCIPEKKEKQKFVYDFPAVLLIIIMMIFAFIMAAIEFGMRHGGVYYEF